MRQAVVRHMSTWLGKVADDGLRSDCAFLDEAGACPPHILARMSIANLLIVSFRIRLVYRLTEGPILCAAPTSLVNVLPQLLVLVQMLYFVVSNATPLLHCSVSHSSPPPPPLPKPPPHPLAATAGDSGPSQMLPTIRDISRPSKPRLLPPRPTATASDAAPSQMAPAANNGPSNPVPVAKIVDSAPVPTTDDAAQPRMSAAAEDAPSDPVPGPTAADPASGPTADDSASSRAPLPDEGAPPDFVPGAVTAGSWADVAADRLHRELHVRLRVPLHAMLFCMDVGAALADATSPAELAMAANRLGEISLQHPLPTHRAASAAAATSLADMAQDASKLEPARLENGKLMNLKP